MFGTDDIFFRSANPDHRTVSKTATQPVCNSHQSVREPLQLKIRSSKLRLSRPRPPVLRRLLHQQPTCGYSAWLSTAFTCTTMFLGAWPDVSYTRACCGSVPGTTQPSACGDALWASRQTKSKILWHLTWCWHTNTHTSTVTHRLRTLCMHELTPSRFLVPPPLAPSWYWLNSLFFCVFCLFFLYKCFFFFFFSFLS